MIDSGTTIGRLRQLVQEFVDRRDWHQFHTPKNLAMSTAIEAAELMEHFQWLTPEQSREVAEQPDKLAEEAKGDHPVFRAEKMAAAGSHLVHHVDAEQLESLADGSGREIAEQ